MSRAFATSTNSEDVSDEKKSAVRASSHSREPVHQISSGHGPQIQRQPSCACGGGCPRCQTKRLESANNPHISSRTDPHEREADHIADQVSRISEHDSVHSPVNLHPSPAPINGPKRSIQTKAAPQAGGGPDAQAAVSTAQRDGTPLSAEARSYFEPRFGVDFGQVRVHADSDAAAAANTIEARAYTVGSNVVFGAGEYAPATDEGKRILAHELTHVVQQASGDTRSAPPIQRFESDEHQTLGNNATDTGNGPAEYDLGTPNVEFKLTHGDIVALVGDVFTEDQLFDLAATPGHKGEYRGTRDEVLWALQDERIWEMRVAKKGGKKGPFTGKKDPRFQPGGAFADYEFSQDVKDAVMERYQKLGAANAGHFVAPQGRNAAGVVPVSNSAGGNYRTIHETSIRLAYACGREGDKVDVALAHEAAAEHFLTDSFSAGHLRTPIQAIRDFWSKKYPMFWYNLRHKIALDTAIDMTNSTAIPTDVGYSGILEKVEAMAPTLPAVTLGDLLGGVFHDYDNKHGLELEGGGRIMGDKYLGDGTAAMAIKAIQVSIADINKAYEIGKQNPEMENEDLYRAVRAANGGVGDKYAAEMQIPEPSKDEPAQNWQADDIYKLWDQPFLGTSGQKVGEVITEAVQGQGTIAVQLYSLAERFPEYEAIVQPRRAYVNGFVKKLQADVKAGLLDIINWSPHGMLTGTAPRQAVQDIADQAGESKTVGLTNLTYQQRVKYLRGLISDGSDSAQELIIKLFRSAPLNERWEIYKAIEEHEWTGDFKRSFGSRDALYKVMNKQNVEVLKDAINGF